jgi:hypothetical protein
MAIYEPSFAIKTTVDSVAAGYPVTVAELKLELRIPVAETAFDAELAIYIAAATEEVERYTGMNFRVKQITAFFQQGEPYLLRGNEIAVVSTANVSDTGVETPVTDSTVSKSDKYALVFVDVSWQAKIVCSTGIATAPDVVKMAIIKYAASMYSGCADSAKDVLTMFLSSYRSNVRTLKYDG